MHNARKHGNYDVPTDWPLIPYKRPYGGTPGAPVMYEKPSDPEDEGAGYGYSNAEQIKEKDVFFYHSDHLGSTSYITDRDGNATQFVSYKPYGEALIDEHATSFESPWKFNGKELDAETGLYYYGARYYEPVLALWYGVDALAEKYPNMGGYVYCAGNPVKLVDVDGNDWVESPNGDITWRTDINETNYKTNLSTTETYRGVFYGRFKEWNNEKYSGLVYEEYHTYGKMTYDPVTNVEITINGEMRANSTLIADVNVSLTFTLNSNRTKSYDYIAVAGGFGNGAPENGDYTTSNYRTRTDNTGMIKHGVGFSFNLNPQFETNRSLLRIHPDGNNEGTLGCIGLSGDSSTLVNFKFNAIDMLKKNDSIPTNINITNNPNNNGQGSIVPNVRE